MSRRLRANLMLPPRHQFKLKRTNQPAQSLTAASWVALWLILSVLYGRWLRAPEHWSWRTIANPGRARRSAERRRFFMVMNTLWGRPPATGRTFTAVQSVPGCGVAPGLLVLTLSRSPSVRLRT